MNAWVLARWAGLEYTLRLDSIEWAYLGLARHYREWGWRVFRGEAEWFPWWYNGVPVENTYPPLLPALTAAVGKVFAVSNGTAYHWATAGLFALGAWGVYWAVWRGGQRRWAALLAGLFYSLVSLSALVMPDIARDLTSPWLNQRLNALARYGEGPHVAALAVLPWVWWALGAQGAAGMARAAALGALVLLSNVIGAMALAWAGLAWGVARGSSAWVWLAGAGLWAWAMAYRFVNVWFLEDVQRNAPLVGGVFVMGGAQYAGLAGLAAVVLGLGWWLRRRGWDAGLVAAIGFAIPMTAFPLAWEWWQFYFLPQPHRYHLEMELAWALVLGLGLGRSGFAGRWLALPVGALLVWAVVGGRDYDRWLEPVQPRETYLERSAAAMRRIDREARVYVIGGPRYYSGLEMWQPQVGGGFLNGMKFRGFAVGDYGTFAGLGNFLDSRDWLLAYGVDYVLVGGKESQDWIRSWVDPGKFVGRLRQVWEDGDDRLYALDRWNQSLAHVLPEGVRMGRTPVAHWGNADLQALVRALEGEENRGGVWEWQGPSRARVRAQLAAGEAIATQVSYDRRWEARVEGRRVETLADGLGQMWIRPGKLGAVEVELRFRNPWWVPGLSLGAWGLAIGIFLWEVTRTAGRRRVLE